MPVGVWLWLPEGSQFQPLPQGIRASSESKVDEKPLLRTPLLNHNDCTLIPGHQQATRMDTLKKALG